MDVSFCFTSPLTRANFPANEQSAFEQGRVAHAIVANANWQSAPLGLHMLRAIESGTSFYANSRKLVWSATALTIGMIGFGTGALVAHSLERNVVPDALGGFCSGVLLDAMIRGISGFVQPRLAAYLQNKLDASGRLTTAETNESSYEIYEMTPRMLRHNTYESSLV